MSTPPIDQQPPADPSTHRRLQRSTGNKMVAGVAGGIAEYANVDPLLVRVLLAVLTVFGGAGILLYALGWLLLPPADAPHSLAETLIGRGRNGGSVLTAVALTAVVVVFAGIALHGRGTDLGLVVLSVVGGVLLYRHLDSRGVTRSTEPPPVDQPTDSVPLLSAPLTYPTNIASQSLDAVNRAADQLAAEQLAAEDRAMHGPWPVPEPDPKPAPPTRRHRSLLGGITVCTLVVLLGVLVATDRLAGSDFAPRTYLAAALGVVGAGLVVGAFRGGARGLIVLGIPLTVAVLAASVVPWHRHAGLGRDYQPATVAEVQPTYRANAGNLNLDLSQLSFTGKHVATSVELGVGQLDVRVPRNVDVTVHAHGRVGDLDIFGHDTNGPSPAVTRTDYGPDGPGGGTLDLTLNIGAGQVEVTRVP